jgi:hypothetical protein
MAKKIICIVTGKSLTIADSYYKKKVDKAGSEEKLHETYICKEAKKLLKLGNAYKKVREILDCDKNLPELDDNLINELIFGNKKRKISIETDFATLTSITHNQTDPDVKVFINKLYK